MSWKCIVVIYLKSWLWLLITLTSDSWLAGLVVKTRNTVVKIWLGLGFVKTMPFFYHLPTHYETELLNWWEDGCNWLALSSDCCDLLVGLWEMSLPCPIFTIPVTMKLESLNWHKSVAVSGGNHSIHAPYLNFQLYHYQVNACNRKKCTYHRLTIIFCKMFTIW